MHKSTIFKSYHRAPVYRIDWCLNTALKHGNPEMSTEDDAQMIMFSCGGDGVVLLSNPAKSSKASVDLATLIQRSNPVWMESLAKPPKRSDLAIHSSSNLLAVGNA